VSPIFSRGLGLAWTWLFKRAPRLIALWGLPSTPQLDAVYEYELRAADKRDTNPPRTPEGVVVAHPDPEILERGIIARRGLQSELENPSTLLLGKQPELFSEVDRLKAEKELRLAVVSPNPRLRSSSRVTSRGGGGR
jgi:hypothetical protein